MKNEYFVVLALTLIFIALSVVLSQSLPQQELPVTCSENPQQSRISLHEPDFKGMILEDAISKRRSARTYSDEAVSLGELSMLLWAGNGITGESGFRSAPSAGALYPIDLYVIPNRVEDLSCGVYRYLPYEHELILVKEGQFSDEVYNLSYGQAHIRNAAVLIVLVATPERTTAKYGERGEDYVLMEAGHIAQNMLLEAVSLGLGAVPVGAFEPIEPVLGLEENQKAIYIVAIGKL